jgi:hypothetical protein
MKDRGLVFSCLIVFLAHALVRANQPDHPLVAVQQQGHAGVYVPAENLRDGQIEVRLSDSLRLVLEMAGRSDLEVAPLASEWASQGWTVRRLSLPKRSKTVNDKLDNTSIRITLELDPQRPGESTITLPPLRYRENGRATDWKKITWQPIPVRVVTAVLQTSLEELRDVAPPEDVPSDYRPPNWIGWLALGTVVLLAIPVGFWLKLRLRRRPAPIPPHHWALLELDRVDVSGLLQAGEEDRLGTLISDILRRYLDMRFHLGASSRTTAEFLAGQSSDGPLSGDHQRVIRELLDHCDLNKFARRPLSQTEGQRLLDQARWLIEQTAQVPLKPNSNI